MVGKSVLSHIVFHVSQV